MRGRQHLPGTVFWRLVAVAGAGAVGFWVFGAIGDQTPRLEAGELAEIDDRVTFAHTQELEERWIGDAFEPVYLLAPVATPPCAGSVNGLPGDVKSATARARDSENDLAAVHERHPNHWLPALALANLQLRNGRSVDAERVLERTYQRGIRDMLNRRYLSADESFGLIHYLYALGHVQLRNNSADSTYFWQLMKNPIGQIKPLANGGRTDLPPRSPTWRKHRIRAPGCSFQEDDLTSFDLYNNLLIAYQREPFSDTKERRETEFHRDYKDPPHVNPLLAALARAKVELIATDEARVWALSNTERLLRERYHVGEGPPDDARLALTMAQIMVDAEPLVPQAARDALWRQIAEVAESAAARRSDVTDREQPRLDAGVARARLLAAVHGAPPSSAVDAAGLTDDQRRTLRRVLLAIDQRLDRERRDALLAGAPQALEALRDGLDDGADGWLERLRRDASEALARAGLDAGPEERVALAWTARRLLQGTAAPESLEELNAQLGAWQHVRHWSFSPPGRATFAALATLLAGLVLLWFARQMILRKALFTSFYRREALERMQRKR